MQIINREYYERGQALLETTLFMPLFLLGFYGVFWAIGSGALSERVQYSVRYAGTISSQSDLYKRLSLESFYSEIDGITREGPASCATADPATLNQNRPVFYDPAAISLSQCHGQSIVINGPETYSIPFFAENNFVKISANMRSNGYLNSIGFPTNSETLSAYQNYFKAPGITTSYLCGSAKFVSKASLEGYFDTRTSTAVQSTFMPYTPVDGTTIATNCSPVSPAPTPIPADTAVANGVKFVIPATPTPTPGPSATATPVPTATPIPTPTPVPTPIPTPTGSPGNYS